MAKTKINWSKLWKTEDWLAVWLGFIVIAIASVAVLGGLRFFCPQILHLGLG